ncbi:MAG: hypothetical protein M3O92_08785 [Actinomycetota bacterium]|nr:hypothetical protein [Actinomycetota bacterium]
MELLRADHLHLNASRSDVLHGVRHKTSCTVRGMSGVRRREHGDAHRASGRRLLERWVKADRLSFCDEVASDLQGWNTVERHLEESAPVRFDLGAFEAGVKDFTQQNLCTSAAAEAGEDGFDIAVSVRWMNAFRLAREARSASCHHGERVSENCNEQ